MASPAPGGCTRSKATNDRTKGWLFAAPSKPAQGRARGADVANPARRSDEVSTERAGDVGRELGLQLESEFDHVALA
jgi:hypothetical protein